MLMDEDEYLFSYRSKIMAIPDVALKVLCSPDIGNWTPTLGPLQYRLLIAEQPLQPLFLIVGLQLTCLPLG